MTTDEVIAACLVALLVAVWLSMVTISRQLDAIHRRLGHLLEEIAYQNKDRRLQDRRRDYPNLP